MKKRKNWLYLIFPFFIFVSASLTVYGAETDKASEDRTLAPYFVIEGGDSATDRFPLKDTTVTTNINGMLAETYVSQTYTNEGNTPINATYVFPASSTAAVHGMQITVGDQTVTAQIREKEEARHEFEEAKSEGKSASLLEQQRPNVFTMDVANIMPGASACIELHYTELIQPVDNSYEFVFPTVVGPRYVNAGEYSEDADDWAVSPYLPQGSVPEATYSINVTISAGVPVSNLVCKSHKINIIQADEATACVTLADSEDYAGNRDFILDYRLTGEEVQSGLLLTRGEEENFFLLTVQPPERYQPSDIPPREYIFTLDISGSMYGHPLSTAKTLIRDLVSGLKKDDRFNLVLFSDDTWQLAPESLPANAENVQKAIRLIEELEGGGGTSMLPALEQALAIPADDRTARSIVLITDGYICDEQEIFQAINENMGSASFFSFGIGSAVNEYLIKGIAAAGMGESFVVTNIDDAASSAERFRTYISAPLMTDIQIRYDGFSVYDVEPAVPSTLFAQKPIVLFGKWNGEAAGTITITGKTGTKDYIQELQVKDAKICEKGNALPLLWARSRLQRLTDYGCHTDYSALQEEVTQLGLDYSIMTPYTSFVAVIDTIVNPEGTAADVAQANPLPLQVSNLAVGGGYTAYSEPGSLLLIFMTAGITLLCARNARKRCRNAVTGTGQAPLQ